MKTPAEWMDGPPPSSPDAWVILIEDIQADARAGMVPEGELHGDRGDGHCQACIGRSVKAEAELAKAHAGMDLFEKRLQHEVDSREAELAKAWEAGRGAALACEAPTVGLWRLNIRALQPPGGKAK